MEFNNDNCFYCKWCSALLSGGNVKYHCNVRDEDVENIKDADYCEYYMYELEGVEDREWVKSIRISTQY